MLTWEKAAFSQPPTSTNQVTAAGLMFKTHMLTYTLREHITKQLTLLLAHVLSASIGDHVGLGHEASCCHPIGGHRRLGEGCLLPCQHVYGKAAPGEHAHCLWFVHVRLLCHCVSELVFHLCERAVKLAASVEPRNFAASGLPKVIGGAPMQQCACHHA